MCGREPPDLGRLGLRRDGRQALPSSFLSAGMMVEP